MGAAVATVGSTVRLLPMSFSLCSPAVLRSITLLSCSQVVEAEKHALEAAQQTARKSLLRLFDDMPTALKKVRKQSEAQQIEVQLVARTASFR